MSDIVYWFGLQKVMLWGWGGKVNVLECALKFHEDTYYLWDVLKHIEYYGFGIKLTSATWQMW